VLFLEVNYCFLDCIAYDVIPTDSNQVCLRVAFTVLEPPYLDRKVVLLIDQLISVPFPPLPPPPLPPKKEKLDLIYQRPPQLLLGTSGYQKFNNIIWIESFVSLCFRFKAVSAPVKIHLGLTEENQPHTECNCIFLIIYSYQLTCSLSLQSSIEAR